MKLVLQRVSKAKVTINNDEKKQIKHGLMVLVSFTQGDNEQIIDKMIDKMINLRIFDDDKGNMNLSLLDVKGSIMSISQFTLYANCKKGRRPSLNEALEYNEAENLYNIFNEKIKNKGILIKQGLFGSSMKIELINEGPITILLDSKEI